MDTLHSTSHVLIIGNGVAGITAARTIRKNSDCRITVLSHESKYFFSRTALMYVYMGHMRFEDTQPYEPNFWSKNRIELVQDKAVTFNFSGKEVLTENGQRFQYDVLILATGSLPNIPPLPGVDLTGVQCLYSKQDLEKLENISSRVTTAVIAGGGLIGIEWVEMLLSRGIQTHFIIREPRFWSNVLPEADSRFVSDELSHHAGLVLHYSSEIEKINGNQVVEGVTLKDGTEIPCQLVGMAIGVSPNIALLRETDIECERGILVDSFLQTNVPHVYAIGDCAQIREPISGRKSVEAIWYSARTMGETLGKSLTSSAIAFDPGVWFNSAKFFDLEYQTYGQMPAQKPVDEGDLILQHGKTLIHLRYSLSAMTFVGANVLGTRARHALMNAWLVSPTPIQTVIEHWKDVEFDPEFSSSNALLLAKEWIQLNPNHPISTSKKRGWWKLLSA